MSDIGDIKEKVKFAFLPVKVDNNIIWLKRYIRVYKYIVIFSPDDIKEKYSFYRTGLGIIKGWVSVKNKRYK